MSVHWPIIRRLLSSPHRIAVRDDRRAYMAIEVLVAAMHVAAVLRSKSEAKNVILLAPTSGVFSILALGCWIAGKVVTPLNYLLKGEDQQYIVDNAEADTVLAVRALTDHTKFVPKAKNVIFVEDLDFSGVPEPLMPPPAEASDLAVILYTSGTSGRPKGVMLTHGNLMSNLNQVLSWIELSPDDSVMGVLPQFHSFGLTVLTLLPLYAKLPVIYSARFVPQKIVKLLREHKPTMIVAIPSMYAALLTVKDATAEDFKSLRIVVSGGEPLPASVCERFKDRFGHVINEGYGLTETSPVTNWCRPGEWRPHSVGMPLPGITERVVDPNTGAVLAPGNEGEMQITGPNVMAGYFNLPEETAKVFTKDGFFRTGDMARMDPDGHTYITGRIKDMLIIGGENVFPREIEEVLDRHPSVAASGVVGTPDDLRGEVPVAFVEIREGESFDEQALRRWCSQSLPGYKVPGRVVYVEALPRSGTGKILRRELRGRV